MVEACQSGNSLFFENEHNDLSCFSLSYTDFFRQISINQFSALEKCRTIFGNA